MRRGVLALCLTGACAVGARADLLVYEGFSYGLDDGTNMQGVTANATGLTGDYGVANVNGATTTYVSGGLSFGSRFFSTGGGALRSSSTNGSADSYSIAGVRLNAGTQTGTLWNSFLWRVSDASLTRVQAVQLRINTTSATQGGTTAYFGSEPDHVLNATNFQARTPGLVYTRETSGVEATPQTQYSLNTTYLTVTKWTGVGQALSAGSPGVGTMWIFTQTGYTNWLEQGGGREDSLSTYAAWTATQSRTTGTYAFNNDRYLQFTSYTPLFGGNLTAVYDEVRWGTSLGSVAVAPTLLVYEGFSYSLAEGTSISGVTANATGLAGAYDVTNVNGGASTYVSGGLSFGSRFFATGGGALRTHSPNVGSSYSIAGVRLGAGTRYDALWNSFLWRVSAATGNNSQRQPSSGTRLNTTFSTQTSATSYYMSLIDHITDNSGTIARIPGVAYTNAIAGAEATPQTQYSLDTTYLTVTKWTGVGRALSAGSPGVGTMWIFTREGYAAWLNDGGGLEAKLDTHAAWTATQSRTTGTYTFGNDRFLQFYSYTGGSQGTFTALYDEVRWGATLQAVAVDPERSKAKGTLIRVF
jgi:hypothetical protein